MGVSIKLRLMPILKLSSNNLIENRKQLLVKKKVVLNDSFRQSEIFENKDYQRRSAKELTNYFRRMKRDEEILDGKAIGWTPKNELSNGRSVMIGLMIGFLTEYATGVNFVDQIKLTVSYLGIVDISD